MRISRVLDAFRLAVCVLVCLSLADLAAAQSFESENGCATTSDDPCQRVGSCSLQGSDWDQTVTVDRSDLYDTMGWPGVCDQVHVALLQGSCAPGGSQIGVTVFLGANSSAVIPQISGSLTCQADPAVPGVSLPGLALLGAALAGIGWRALRRLDASARESDAGGAGKR
jgi:hypothetical protein